MAYVKDASHWLFKLSPDEWMSAAMGELSRASAAYAGHDGRAGLAGCRRAAGMALNALLIVQPEASFGRTYVEHIAALGRDVTAPLAVQRACKVLLDTQPPGGPLVSLRGPRTDGAVVEAAKDVMAHAYAVVLKGTPLESGESESL